MVSTPDAGTDTSHSSINSPNAPPFMAKHAARGRGSSLLSDSFLFAGGFASALLLFWVFSISPASNLTSSWHTAELSEKAAAETAGTPPVGVDMGHDPPYPTFYDDPDLSYTVSSQQQLPPMEDWDAKRRLWLERHPSFAPGAGERVLILTGSQASPCRNPIGDNLLLRFFKNKVDYGRIHGYDVFYNNALLHPEMGKFWAKLPVVRAAMVAHPEVEWIWWVDSDAAVTDMEFKLPLARYARHNLVVHGWSHLVFEARSWTSINAGVFLIRNCQWSMDLIEVWAEMGPQSPDYSRWGRIQRSTFKDKLFPESDDQAGLIWLLLKEKDTWADRIYVEGEYYLQGYWLDIVGGGELDNATAGYEEMERGDPRLRRRRAEAVTESLAAAREEHLRGVPGGRGSRRRPFVTHFTGCQPCSGDHNQIYSGESCWRGMEKVLNFADNQVLRNYGFVRRDVQDTASVSPLPFDFPRP